jgi:dipeptidyl aminopeptidase/acylaminoacyl peptidase
MVYFLGVDDQHDNWELFSYHLIYDNLNQITQMKEDGSFLGLAHDGKSVLYGYESAFYPYHRIKIFNWYGNEIFSMEDDNILYAAWHPDRLKMLFISDKDKLDGELYSIWKDGSNEQQLTDDYFQMSDFSISPEGSYIACSVFVNGNYEIMIIQLESF